MEIEEVFKQAISTGFEIRMVRNPVLQKGKAILMLHPDDYDSIYKQQKAKANG